MYIDFHTHKPIHNDAEIVEIISAHREPKYADPYYTIGHHPWWSDSPLIDEELIHLRGHLSNPKCLGVGECGLDKLKGASREMQEAVFHQQIKLANVHQSPLIMHCVRQYDRAIQIKKEVGNTQWCIHGFRRNKILAQQLLDTGTMLSISPILRMPASFIELIEYLPLDMFFIETDSEYSMTIKERYDVVAHIKKIDIFALRQQMVNNFNKLFEWKQLNLIGLSEQNY